MMWATMENEPRHRYEYSVDLDSDAAATRVVRMVGKGKRVLEIGAGPGSIARMLQHAGNCRVTAIEIDADAIRKLTPFCERVYQADLNDPYWLQALNGDCNYEVVVAADVLGHLYDPWSTLRAMKNLIGKNGFIVVSLPHVGHSSVVACLLQEDFEYREWGLLDRTHIRFFGIKNIQALFEQAGLKIVEGQFVIRSPEHTEFAERWKRMPREFRDVLSMNRYGTVYQVVVKAVPNESPGHGISLLSLPVEAPTGIRAALKAQARAYLSAETRLRLRRIAARLGLRL